MRRARSAEPKPMLRSIRWGAVVGSALAAFVVVSGALAGFTSLTTGGAQTIVTKRIFLGPRSLAAQDLRDASSGAETNKSDAYSYADGTVATTSTAIASGTNNYVEFTMSSARRRRPLGLRERSSTSVSRAPAARRPATRASGSTSARAAP